METHRVELTAEEHRLLNLEFPESAGSGLIGRRAEQIVRLFFQRRYPKCEFRPPDSGADLKVVPSPGQAALCVEIKGTASAGVAWQQLKVSSRHSHKLLSEASIPVYRVSEVFSQSPVIYVLKHGTDFVLEPEERWTFKPLGLTRIRPTLSNLQTRPRVAEPMASKYEPLRNHLKSQAGAVVTLSFTELSNILGFELPESAYKHRAFWGNQDHTKNRPWARAWQAAGYAVESVKQSSADGWVRFRRQHS